MRCLLVSSVLVGVVGCGAPRETTAVEPTTSGAPTARLSAPRAVARASARSAAASCPQPRDCAAPPSADFPGPKNSDGTAKQLPPALPVRAGEMLMLCYDDFGPQSMAVGLLGSEWWSWEAGGSFEPGDRFDVRVIVHADGERTAAEMRYPTERGVADYRIVSRADALAHLDAASIELASETDEILVRLRERLLETRATIDRCVR